MLPRPRHDRTSSVSRSHLVCGTIVPRLWYDLISLNNSLIFCKVSKKEAFIKIKIVIFSFHFISFRLISSHSGS